VNARFLLAVFDSAYVLALTAWVGNSLVYLFEVAPILTQELGAEPGAKFLRAFLPRYYTWGAIAGAIALPAYLGVPLSFQEYRGPVVAVQSGLILAGTLLMLYAANSLTPAMQTARAGGTESKPRLDRLERRSNWLNGVVLVLGLVLLVAFATRPAPTTAGIIELSPQERARSAYEQIQARESAAPVPTRQAR